MTKHVPAWAQQAATSDDHGVAQEAHRQGRLDIRWPNASALRIWAKQHGWPTPLLGFEQAFTAHMLAAKEHFALAIQSSGIEVYIPRRSYAITRAQLGELDALYEQRSSSGRPTDWGVLVEELREIRRAVEAGVAVTVEGEGLLLSWQDFYQWAHGRYHMLEDGYDKWIGDDS